MTAELPGDVIALGELALAFGRVPRITYHPDGTTPESDTDHTVMLSLIACSLAGRLGLDVGEVAQLALIHDLVEVYAGDTATLRQPSAQDTAAKRRREHESFERIRARFGQAFPWLVEALQRYERQDSREARFVRGLDKCIVKITHLLNGCVTVRAQGMTPAELRRRYAHQRSVEMVYAADLPLVLELHAALADAEVDLYQQSCAPRPRRWQRRRTPGWRMPAGAVYVGRPGPWGNPATVAEAIEHGIEPHAAPAAAVRRYRAWLLGEDPGDQDSYQVAGRTYDRRWIREHLAELAGRDLVCWCPPDQPCHADVLIELANRPARAEAA